MKDENLQDSLNFPIILGRKKVFDELGFLDTMESFVISEAEKFFRGESEIKPISELGWGYQKTNHDILRFERIKWDYEEKNLRSQENIKRQEDAYKEFYRYRDKIDEQTREMVDQLSTTRHFLDTFPEERQRKIRAKTRQLLEKFGPEGIEKLRDWNYADPDSGSKITPEEFTQHKIAFGRIRPRSNIPYQINAFSLRLTHQYQNAKREKDDNYADTLLDFTYKYALGAYIEEQKRNYRTNMTKEHLGKALMKFDLTRRLSWEDRHIKKDENGNPFDIAKEVDWFKEIKSLLLK